MKRLAALLFLALTSCNDSTAPRSVVGEWELRTYAESPLPSGHLVSEVLTVRDGGTFEQERTFQTGPAKTVVGTWVSEEGEITFLTAGRRRAGSLYAGELTVRWDAASSVYARR